MKPTFLWIDDDVGFTDVLHVLITLLLLLLFKQTDHLQSVTPLIFVELHMILASLKEGLQFFYVNFLAQNSLVVQKPFFLLHLLGILTLHLYGKLVIALIHFRPPFAAQKLL